jgi:hypothetical protein
MLVERMMMIIIISSSSSITIIIHNFITAELVKITGKIIQNMRLEFKHFKYVDLEYFLFLIFFESKQL